MIDENHDRSDYLGSYRPPNSQNNYRLYVFRGDGSNDLPPDLLAFWDESSTQCAQFTGNTESREAAAALYVAFLLNSECQGHIEDPVWDNLKGRYQQEYQNLVIVSR